jgi:hypothetical protein
MMMKLARQKPRFRYGCLQAIPERQKGVRSVRCINLLFTEPLHLLSSPFPKRSITLRIHRVIDHDSRERWIALMHVPYPHNPNGDEVTRTPDINRESPLTCR